VCLAESGHNVVCMDNDPDKVLTEESSAELVERIRPMLGSMTVVGDYRCRTVLDDVVGKSGNLDVLATYVREAWQESRKRNNPNYVRQPETAETIIVGNMENREMASLSAAL
jgi:hypothetical protein